MAGQTKTLRLMMPQWQGGDSGMRYPGPTYPLGARLLAFLAPESDAPLVEVPVEPYTGAERKMQDGVVWHDDVLRQTRAARDIIDAHAPDRVIMFGGDCLVSQAPFAYLNERYGGKVGLIWLDAHPDLTTPDKYPCAHTYVLGNLMGHGDPVLAQEVRIPYPPDNVLLVGVHDMQAHEEVTVRELGLRVIAAEAVNKASTPVLDWMRERGFEHVAIHVDLDVLEHQRFRSQFLWNSLEEVTIQTADGRIHLPALTRLITDIESIADVAGFSFTEHLPWDAVHLKTMMASFSFMQ